MSSNYTPRQWKLIERLLSHSSAPDWESAKTEWHLEQVYHEPDNRCLCGHAPITECCIIRNQHSDRSVLVGNCCVKRVCADDTANLAGQLLRDIKRLSKTPSAAPGATMCSVILSSDVFSDWEKNFTKSTYRKRPTSLTEKQLHWRLVCNQKLLTFLNNPAKENLNG